ncbi:MAG TPA: hypothetical protein VJ946_05530 [Bacteroidales bacterium]|nr:hypothetical protein [Bacteroidales bacterium]
MKVNKLYPIAAIALLFFACEQDNAGRISDIPELEGYWKLHQHMWTPSDTEALDGAVKTEQNGKLISFTYNDSTTATGIVSNNTIRMSSDFLEINTFTIVTPDSLVSTSTSNKAAEYSLQKINLNGNWEVTDYWWDGSQHDKGTWEITQTDSMISITDTTNTAYNGWLHYDTIHVDDIQNYGIDRIFIRSKDSLMTNMPLLESSNGLIFKRQNNKDLRINYNK